MLKRVTCVFARKAFAHCPLRAARLYNGFDVEIGETCLKGARCLRRGRSPGTNAAAPVPERNRGMLTNLLLVHNKTVHYKAAYESARLFAIGAYTEAGGGIAIGCSLRMGSKFRFQN